MPHHTYASTQLREQLERGPYAGEDFFRLQVTGDEKTKWVNVTPRQLTGIIATLEALEELDREEESAPPPAPRPFNYSGALLVRMRAEDIDTARALLGAAAHAALEADPFIVAVEGTNVSRKPGPMVKA